MITRSPRIGVSVQGGPVSRDRVATDHATMHLASPTSSSRSRRALAALAAVVATACLAAPPPAGAAPNVVVIQLDDQPLSMFTQEVLPNTFARIVEPGTEFTNYFTVAPTCCPSRATLLTGQYPHNHGVLSNTPGYADLQKPGNILPVWLQRAGYETAHIGKYLNNYGKAVGDRTVPAGWDHWIAALEPRRYYRYVLTVDGRRERFGADPNDHLTRVLNRKAATLAGNLARGKAPFFLALDHFAPHKGAGDSGRCAGAAVPDPVDLALFEGEPLPQDALPKASRSLNEQDVTDKPGFVATQPFLSVSKVSRIRERWGCAMAASYSADRGVEAVFQAIRAAGEIRQTAFIYISDNGLFYGEHRVPGEKQLPYEEVIHQPLAIRVPSAYVPAQGPEAAVDVMAANLDIAPTILHLARARPCRTRNDCRTMDGRSLTGPLGGSTLGFAGRRLLVEFDLGRKHSRERIACKFAALRTSTESYARYQQVVVDAAKDRPRCRRRLQVEHYDLAVDPMQLDSLWLGTGLATAEQRALRLALSRLRRCAGIEGRDHRTGRHPFCE